MTYKFAKRSRIVLFAVLVGVLVLASALPAFASDRGPLNGVNGVEGITKASVDQRMPSGADIERRISEVVPAFDERAPSAVSCDVRDSTGTSVTTIPVSHVGDPSNWFYYGSGGAASNTVNFYAFPYSPPGVLTTLFQAFDVSATPTTSIVTPFGIPFWGGDLTSGVWILVTYNDVGGGNYCVFNVVP
ncbi:MAG: hypothetical protein U9R25_13055 [Chloroflexota bacterium]|nr:hypothetical protein [Chloroflexota bacterium]